VEGPGIRFSFCGNPGIDLNEAFTEACLHDPSLPLIQRMVSLGVNPRKARNRYGGWTGLYLACHFPYHYQDIQRQDVVRYLLVDCECDPNLPGLGGMTAMHKACERGNENIVALMLDHHGGADIHATFTRFGCSGTTPFLLAVQCNNSHSTIQLLLDRGACIHDKNSRGETALHLVAGRRPWFRLDIVVSLLLNRGADFLDRDIQGDTPFDSAHSAGYTNACNLLIDSFRVHLLANHGDLALHVTLRHTAYEQTYNRRGVRELRFNTELGKLTMEHYTTLLQPFLPYQIHIRDGQGMLPLHIAAGNGTPLQFLEILMSRDACRVPDITGALPLHHACRAGAPIEVIRRLVVTGGVDTVRKQDLQGRLPLHSLFQNDLNRPTLDVVQYLVGAHPPTVLLQR